MNARNTRSAAKAQARRTRSPATGGQWWKAWVLLTGLGATVLGWMAFPSDEQPPANGIGSSQVSMSVEDAPALRVEPIDRTRQAPNGTRMLPAMPQKPVFRAPVSRTRRS
jgi:hypothetical protein